MIPEPDIVVNADETGTDNVPSVSAPETAPVESAENASSSTVQESSSTTVSTPPNVSSRKYPERAIGKLQIDTNQNFYDFL